MQNAVTRLQSADGLKSAARLGKLEIMQELIQEHVRTTHKNISSGNEMHYVNAYFNSIAKLMGVPKRKNPFIDIGRKEIDRSQIDQCRKAVFYKLKPGMLATDLANKYLDRIKVAVSSAGISTKNVLEGETLTRAHKTIEAIKMATLNSEFGEVPQTTSSHKPTTRSVGTRSPFIPWAWQGISWPS